MSVIRDGLEKGTGQFLFERVGKRGNQKKGKRNGPILGSSKNRRRKNIHGEKKKKYVGTPAALCRPRAMKAHSRSKEEREGRDERCEVHISALSQKYARNKGSKKESKTARI